VFRAAADLSSTLRSLPILPPLVQEVLREARRRFGGPDFACPICTRRAARTWTVRRLWDLHCSVEVIARAMWMPTTDVELELVGARAAERGSLRPSGAPPPERAE
jgi:hypothetical protein